MKLLLALLFIITNCPELRKKCEKDYAHGKPRAEWCDNGLLEEWCPPKAGVIDDANGITVEEKKDPTGRLRVSPRMGIAPLAVLASVYLENRNEDFYCPSVEFQWAEEFTSKIESDCPPWDELTEEEQKELYVISRPSPGGYPEGEWEIKVILRQGKRSIVLRETVMVH